MQTLFNRIRSKWGVPGLFLLMAQAARAAPFAYIPVGDEIKVIDTATDTVSASVSLGAGSGAAGLAVNATGTRVYMAAAGVDNVAVFDTSTNTVTTRVRVVGPQAVAVNPAGTFVYITHVTDSTDGVAVMDTASNTIVAEVPIPRGPAPRNQRPFPFGVVVSPDGNRVYVANIGSDNGTSAANGYVSVLDTTNNTVIANVTVGNRPTGIAITPDGTQIYVANQGSNTVSVLNTTDNSVIATVPVGQKPYGVAINAAGTRAYVANFFGASYSTIDTRDPCGVALETAIFGNPVGASVNPDGSKLYLTVSNASGGTVTIVKTATNQVVSAFGPGGSVSGFGVFFSPGVAPPPDPVAQPPIRVTGIEVTQGIQDVANSVLLVSGRRTFVRVHVVSDGDAIENVTASLTGLGTYATIGTPTGVNVPLQALVPINAAGQRITVRPAPKRSNIDDSFLFELPWEWTNFDSLRFNVVLSADAGPPKHSCVDQLLSAPFHEFELPTALTVQFVRLGYSLPSNTSSPVVATSLANQYRAESWMRRAYPLSTLVTAPDLYLFDSGLGARVAQTSCVGIYDPDDLNLCAHDYVESQLLTMQLLTGFMGKADAAYGLIPQISRTIDKPGAYFTRGAFNTPRVGAGPIASDPGITYDYYASHEIGHFLGRQHPVQASAECKHSASDPNYPYFFTFIAPPLSDPQTALAGFDGGDASAQISKSFRSPNTTFDLMGYCGGEASWISDYTYKGLYSALRNLHPSDTVPRKSSARTARTLAQAITAQTGDWLLLAGNISPASARAVLLQTLRTDRVFEIPARTPGIYSIRLKDAAGSTLADYPFSAVVATDAVTAGGESSPLLSFMQVVPFVNGTAAIQIVDGSHGDALLGGKVVSANAPVVGGVALQGPPDPATGIATLAWTASDPDGDALTYDVFYTRDAGASLKPVLLGVSATSAQIETARLPGGNAQLRVMASDGVKNASADSAVFTLANKPPAPRILTPEDGSSIHAGGLLNLEGNALDPLDGVVADTGLAWSAGSRALGTGSRLSLTDLPVGADVITLTATNSLGLSAATTVTVNVMANIIPPGPTLTAGPARLDWHVAVGETQPQTATLDVGNSGAGVLHYAAQSSAPWLTLSTASGIAPATLTVSAAPTDIAASMIRRATVTLTSTDAPGQTITIPVSLAAGDIFTVAAAQDSEVTPPPPPPPAPTVTIAVSPASITAGASATLTWSSTHATACTASGAWTGTEVINGTQAVTPATAGSYAYSLNCSGDGGSASASATLTVNLPTVTVTAKPKSGGGAMTLPWLMWLMLLALLRLMPRPLVPMVRPPREG
jgi:YVTN family beta-propeller protein